MGCFQNFSKLKFFSHVYTVQQTSRHLRKISIKENVIWQIERGMIALSNNIKVLNMCWKGKVLWPREVTPNQALNLCTVTFGTEYIIIVIYREKNGKGDKLVLPNISVRRPSTEASLLSPHYYYYYYTERH